MNCENEHYPPVYEISSRSEWNSATTEATTEVTMDNNSSPHEKDNIPKIINPRDYSIGSFLMLKQDAEQDTQLGDPNIIHPCIWRIYSKALLQKYKPFHDDGKIRYQSTSIYMGWSTFEKDFYIPITVTVHQQNNQSMVVDFNWELAVCTARVDMMSISSNMNCENEHYPPVYERSRSEWNSAATEVTMDNNSPPHEKDNIPKIINARDYSIGSFLMLKQDAEQDTQLGDPNIYPCIWRIDGKALLQKYKPFDDNGKIRYQSTSIYTGWSTFDKDFYVPVTVTIQQQNDQSMVVDFNWELAVCTARVDMMSISHMDKV